MAIWDSIVRVWLVMATWLALRRPASPDELAAIVPPGRFVRAAIVPAGRGLALAIACLPRRRRGEARVTLLIGQALCEIDRAAAEVDLSADATLSRDRVRAAVAFLTGEIRDPPRVGQGTQSPRDRAPRLAAVLAARLPTLRAALEALSGDAVRRCRAMIEQLGDSVIYDRAEGRRAAPHGSVDTVGEAVIYAMRLAAPSVRPPDATCRAVGRAIRLIHELDAPGALPASQGAGALAGRELVLSRALAELSHVPRLARWLPRKVGGGTRAAAALLVTAECARLLREIVGDAALNLHPLRAALAAAWSRRGYLDAIDLAIRAVLDARPAAVATVTERSAALDGVTGRSLVTTKITVANPGGTERTTRVLDLGEDPPESEPPVPLVAAPRRRRWFNAHT
ncbi:MAG TPA: hypothetical protein VH165_32465 [Kofleriaceae bacterium]|nr:hypothetical protein [Kofleriaceae bacterium]